MSRGLWNTAAQFVERGYAAKAPWYFNTPLLSSRGGTTASLPGEQPYDADAARIHKSVRVCSHMVHHKIPRTKLRGIFYCLFLRELPFVHHWGREWLAAEVTAACSGNRKSVGQWYVPARKMPQCGIFRARESPRCLKRDFCCLLIKRHNMWCLHKNSPFYI